MILGMFASRLICRADAIDFGMVLVWYHIHTVVPYHTTTTIPYAFFTNDCRSNSRLQALHAIHGRIESSLWDASNSNKNMPRNHLLNGAWEVVACTTMLHSSLFGTANNPSLDIVIVSFVIRLTSANRSLLGCSLLALVRPIIVGLTTLANKRWKLTHNFYVFTDLV